MTPEFEKLLSWGGSPQAQCSCGRIHYAASGQFMEPGELDGLEAMRHAYPERYIPVAEDSVGVTSFNGSTVVWNCPCGTLDKIERFFWGNRKAIISYYQARTQRELKEASETAAALDGLGKADSPE